MSDDREMVTRVVAKQAAPALDPYPGLRFAHRMILMMRREEGVAMDLWVHRDPDASDEDERGLFARLEFLKEHRAKFETDFIAEVATTFGWPTSLDTVQP